jgi:hypothetical protein
MFSFVPLSDRPLAEGSANRERLDTRLAANSKEEDSPCNTKKEIVLSSASDHCPGL